MCMILCKRNCLSFLNFGQSRKKCHLQILKVKDGVYQLKYVYGKANSTGFYRSHGPQNHFILLLLMESQYWHNILFTYTVFSEKGPDRIFGSLYGSQEWIYWDRQDTFFFRILKKVCWIDSSLSLKELLRIFINWHLWILNMAWWKACKLLIGNTWAKSNETNLYTCRYIR